MADASERRNHVYCVEASTNPLVNIVT